MRAWRVVGAALALSLAVFGQQPVRRVADGQWVREVKGTAPAAGVERLKVLSPGRVSVRPAVSTRPEIVYTWSHRVHARSEAEARARLESVRMRIAAGEGWCVLDANQADLMQSELTVLAPAGLRQIVIEAASGSVSVRGLRGDVMTATAAGSVEMDEIDGNVTVRTGGGAMTFGRIGGALRCLSGGGTIRATKVGGEAVLESAGGEIWLNEAGGAVRASTAGNIHIGKAGGMVSAHTAGGLIEVEKAAGVVTAENAGGPIVIGEATGVRAESANGGIRMGRVTGVVRASTASGSIFLGLGEGAPIGNSFVASGRGDITVSIPPRVGVSVKALNESRNWYNRVVSDFAEVKSNVQAGQRGQAVLAEGEIHGGGALLLMSVGNGSVYLRRSK